MKDIFSSPGVVRVEGGGDLGIEHQALHQLFITCVGIAMKQSKKLKVKTEYVNVSRKS